MRRPATLVAIGLSIALVACSRPVPPSDSVAPSDTGRQSEPPATATASGPLTLEAQGNGLAFGITLDRAVVEPGGTVTLDLLLRNGRDEPVPFLPACGESTASVRAAVPTDPAGLDWPALGGTFKSYVLEQGLAPGGVPALEPLALPARGGDCEANAELAPGDAYEARLTWTASYVGGVGLIPGEYPFTAQIGVDAVQRGGLVQVETMTVEATVTVAGDAPTLLTAGQAIDVILADPRFAGWLQLQPPESWANANIFLEGGVGEGIVPPVAHWSIELFREPRNWAIAYVDPVTGEHLGTHLCNQPCDR